MCTQCCIYSWKDDIPFTWQTNHISMVHNIRNFNSLPWKLTCGNTVKLVCKVKLWKCTLVKKKSISCTCSETTFRYISLKMSESASLAVSPLTCDNTCILSDNAQKPKASCRHGKNLRPMPRLIPQTECPQNESSQVYIWQKIFMDFSCHSPCYTWNNLGESIIHHHPQHSGIAAMTKQNQHYRTHCKCGSSCSSWIGDQAHS